MDHIARVAVPAEMVELLEGPLAVRPHIVRTFAGWVAEGSIPLSALNLQAAARQPAAHRNGTAVISVMGPITRRPTALSFLCGGASTEQLSADLQAALDDPSVSRIVLAIDSPGGTVDGIPELADEIFRARSQKPITAFVDTVAASAAYWLASQANEIVMTESGQVGSIGVFAMHTDVSEALKGAGVKNTFIHAGRFKVEGNPYEPLTDDARAHFQEMVDAAYAMFTRDVARGRGVPVDTVRGATWGEGRMLLAADAVKAGLADRIGTVASAGLQRISTGGNEARAERDRLESQWLRSQHARREGGRAVPAVMP